ncbi:hypothetical protein ABIB59_001353 [Citrobacter sp. UYEF32]
MALKTPNYLIYLTLIDASVFAHLAAGRGAA